MAGLRTKQPSSTRKDNKAIIRIRPYILGDYKHVRALLIEGKLFDEVWDSEANLTDKIRRSPESILVAELHGRVVGSVYIMEDGWCAFIYRLVVSNAERERGIGTRLMEAAESQLRAKGVAEVCLFVSQKKGSLQAWYSKRGYGGNNVFRSMWKKLK